MQTPFHALRTSLPWARRACAMACICATAIVPAACSTPRVSGRAEAERQASPCERAYAVATSSSATMSDLSQHAVIRYLAARNAASAWERTAAQCPSRFADGTMHAAQSRFMARSLASRTGMETSDVTLARFDGVESLDIDASSASTMAQAEDAAGFATQVLAARSAGPVTLDVSDRHKVTSQRLVSLSGQDDDRRKIYDAAELIAHPDTSVDDANGISASTSAIIEMDCARIEIEAVAGSTASQSTSEQSRSETLAVLSSLIADRAELAFEWGYPTFDEALFE